MATTTAAAAAMAAPARTAARRSFFYVWMAAACAAVAIGGFLPTYWLQLPGRTFIGPPLLHIHGALFTAWTLLLLSQTLLAARGRLRHHRAWGLAGIALASAMVVVGIVTAIYSLKVELAAGHGDAARTFLIVPLTALALFAGFFVAAIVNLEHAETHKRLMLLATITLLQAAVGRVGFILATGGGPGRRPGLAPPPPMIVVNVSAMILLLFVVAGAVHDWRRSGRPSRVWLIGGAVIAVAVLLHGPIGHSAAWLAFADWTTRIAA
ncbi:MAG: hypothetical protein JWO81_1418 [Alphaproteobacteria bacterium]|nr:hypothetical protein [Alphaproteobacteria bacterium]